MPSIAVVDYGSGNIRSIENALKAVSAGLDVEVTRDPVRIEAAERLILPGVGAFPECMAKLNASGVLPAVTRAVKAGRPLLGICVGMQVLADEGLEFEPTRGLGWVPGTVRRLEAPGEKLPHVGWTPVEFGPNALFAGLLSGSHFYFVHSYTFAASDPTQVVARARHGENFTAALATRNVAGVQFHPEKSDRAGLKLLENYCRWIPRLE